MFLEILFVMILPQLVTNYDMCSKSPRQATRHFDAWQKSPIVQGFKSLVSKLLFNLIGHSEPADYEGWMVSGQETVFCWVPIPNLNMVVSSALFFTTYVLTTHLKKPQPLPMYKPSTYLVVTYFPICLPIYETYFLQKWLPT
jgi:hypothetical protein